MAVAPDILFLMLRFLSGFVFSLSLAGSLAAAPDTFDKIASDAEIARSHDHVADAIRLYRAGTQMRPGWADGWWYLGTLLYDQDRFDEAGVAFQHLPHVSNHQGPAHAFLGLCNYEAGNYDQALAQFRAWASAGWEGPPQFRDVAIFHFALLLTRDSKFVESLYLLSPLAQRLGDRPELVEAMGLASLRMHDIPENYAPANRERIWLAGKAAMYAAQSPKDFDRAEEYAAKLEAHYASQPDIHYFRGTLYGFEKKQAEAENEFREELKISPQHAPSLTALASMDLDKGEVTEAGTFARRAVDADPADAQAHHLLGRVLLANGDLQGSANELETAKHLSPDIAEVRSHLAMVYNRLGRLQEAKAETAAFLALKSKEEVMAPANVKLGAAREKTH